MTKHPAKFNDKMLPTMDRMLARDSILAKELTGWKAHVILDPFAGAGRIHELADSEPYVYSSPGRLTIGVEIEPEWADMHPRTIQANALELPFPDHCFDAIVTSPTYGNRMADHHDAKDKSRRLTYRHTIGHELHEDNTGRMQWGKKYRQTHYKAWIEAIRVLKPGGMFIVALSDHIRKKKVQKVTQWHVETLENLGLEFGYAVKISTPRMGFGANADARVPHETVNLLVKPTP